MPALSPDPLRVVLFGPPGAGKTSLLEALAETARAGMSSPSTVENTVRSDQFISSRGNRKPNQQPRPGSPTIAVHPLEIPVAPARTETVELLDCDGSLAERVLAGDFEAVDGRQAALEEKVLHADVLVLPVDAAADPQRLDELFASFTRFLRTLEEARGQRVEVSGLPVFLVLTRCDLLALPSDGMVSWTERIEERKRAIEGHFREFLAQTDADSGEPFGDVGLRLWATATRRPALLGTTRLDEPFGVAELFRQCCEAGDAYRAAQRRSGFRLALAMTGVGSLVLLLFVLSLGLLLRTPPRPLSPLEQSVQTLRFTDRPTAAERLADPVPELEKRQDSFKEVRLDKDFGTLPEDARAFVLLREDELNRYLKLRDLVLEQQPADATSHESLEAKRAALESLALPSDWTDTEVARERTRLLDEADRLRRAADRASAWFDRSSAEAAAILRGDHFRGRVLVWNEWSNDAQGLLNPDQGPGARLTPNPETPIEGTRGLQEGLVLAYPEVAQKAALWAERKGQLERTVQAVAELGLVRLPGGRQALLTFADGFTLNAAEGRLKLLRDAAPGLLDPDLRLDNLGLGQAVRDELSARAREQYQYLLGLERQILLGRFKDYDPTNRKESGQRWAFVVEGLPPSGDLAPAWVRLAGILARLQDPPAPSDPVADLRAFLQPDREFPLWARTIRLEIPPSVGASPLPGARLRVLLGAPDKPASEAVEVMTYDLVDRSGGAPQTATFIFQRKDRGSVLYLPRSPLRLELLLDKGEKFTWDQSRTESFQFEALQREPWRHQEGTAPDTGTREKYVRLRVLDQPAPGESAPWPRVPDLLPDVRGAR